MLDSYIEDIRMFFPVPAAWIMIQQKTRDMSHSLILEVKGKGMGADFAILAYWTRFNRDSESGFCSIIEPEECCHSGLNGSVIRMHPYRCRQNVFTRYFRRDLEANPVYASVVRKVPDRFLVPDI